MKLISIIIPTHFRSDRLDRAVRSAMNQDYEKIEIIVVSDGYDESTELLMRKMQREDSRISFYSYEISLGGNHARNVGIKNAKGEYLAFLDDDDFWYSDKISKQLKIIENNPKIGIVGCAIRVVYCPSGVFYYSAPSDKGNVSNKILYGNLIGSCSCVMVKKSVLETCGTFDENLKALQDFDLWIRICQKFDFDYVSTPELDYNVYENHKYGQQVSNSLEKYIDAQKKILVKYETLYKKISLDKQRELDAYLNLGIAKRAYEIGVYKETAKYGKIAWKKKKSLKAVWYMFFQWIPYKFMVRTKSILQKINTLL